MFIDHFELVVYNAHNTESEQYVLVLESDQNVVTVNDSLTGRVVSVGDSNDMSFRSDCCQSVLADQFGNNWARLNRQILIETNFHSLTFESFNYTYHTSNLDVHKSCGVYQIGDIRMICLNHKVISNF